MILQRAIVIFVVIFVCLHCLSSKKLGKKKKNRNRGKQCALFRDPNLEYVKNNGPSYIRLDPYDFTGNLEISFWVLPDKKYHNGPIFNVGSQDDFKYYEYQANHTQFLVVEIISGSVSLLTKALNKYYLHQLELYNTYPTPYNLIDGHWQHIRATREAAVWQLSLNESISKSEPVLDLSDVNLWGRTGYLGGRPGYQDNVFRGIIRDLYVNGEAVPLSGGRELVGNAEVHDCESLEVEEFIEDLLRDDDSYNDGYQGDSPLYYYYNGYFYPVDDSSEDRREKWEKKLKQKGHN